MGLIYGLDMPYLYWHINVELSLWILVSQEKKRLF